MFGNRRLRVAVLWLVLLIGLPVVSASSAVIAVLHPVLTSHTAAAYRDTLRGLRQRLNDTLVAYPLDESTSAAELRAALLSRQPSAVITLGSSATRTFEALQLTIPHVIGGLNTSPQTRPLATSISLAVDPDQVFATLRRVAPAVQRVHVIFNPQRERWIIEQAEAVAGAQGLTLQRYAADDIRQSATHVYRILRDADPHRDSLWLLWNNRLIDPQIVLPEIIQQAWARRLIVFSSTLSHAQYGAFFSVYPDSLASGERLADLALERIRVGQPLGVRFATNVQRAISLRVADRLALNINQTLLREFEVVYGR